MPEFQRPPQAFRYAFKGLKTNQLPDALPEGKYAMALNVRALQDTDIQSRPGQRLRFTTSGGVTITDINTYAVLNTDDAPRVLSRDTGDRIFLGGTQVGSLVNSAAIKGASMLPFRPGASPNPYMYVANGLDYQKFSAPDPVTGIVVQAKTGIAEPQTAPDATVKGFAQNIIPANPGGSWTQGGTAGAVTPNAAGRVNDIAGAVLLEPVLSLYSVEVTPGISYQADMTVQIAGTNYLVLDVFPQNATPINISGIYYFAGATGRCVFVPSNMAGGGEGASIYSQNLLAVLRRGAIIKFSGGPEKCLVLSVTTGPDGTICIETSTTNTHTTAETITVLPAIQVFAGALNISPPPTEVRNPTVVTTPDPAQGGSAGTTPIGGPYPAYSADLTCTSGGSHLVSALWTAWGAATGAYTSLTLSVSSVMLLTNVLGFGPSTATIEYSIDGGATWQTLFTQSFSGGGSVARGTGFPGPYAVDTVTLPPGTSLANVQVRARTSCTVNGFASLDIVGVETDGVLVPILIPATGNTIISNDVAYAVTAGVGTETAVLAANPFVTAGVSFQPDDYISIGLLVDNPTVLTEMKFLIDVGDGTFTEDFYYYTVRASDIAAAVANQVTQLSAAQTVAQRALIDELTPAISGVEVPTDAGAQMLAGANRWVEIVFPISALTRVGSNSTFSLQTANRIQYLWNVSNTLNVATSETIFFGTGQPDVGDVGQPYLYRLRPRSKLTGAVGNPSPATRYGVSLRRMAGYVKLLSAAYDLQIDTWDIFRYGGTVTSWRYIGSAPSSAAFFIDNYSDDAALAGDLLEEDNFEPWPSIDIPNNGTGANAVGFTAVVTSTDPDLISYLPGTLVQLGGVNVYTLQTRPTLLSANTYLLQFIENAGAQSAVTFNIQEPIIARQFLPYMWGPDASGTVFACGDALRPGTVSFAKNYAPDSAPDGYNLEIVQPSEPLLGGEILDGLSFVASPERWWALYPTPDNPSQRFSIVQQPFLRGLAAPFGHCNDGVSIYWWAKDGIYSSTKGSLTEADLFNLFPHEGVVGVDVTYAGVTVHAPDYSRCGTFRLTFSNGYLYATYQDTTGTYHTLVLDTIDSSWSLDDYADPVACFFHPPQEPGTLSSVVPARYDELLMGDVNGVISAQEQGQNDIGGPISCVLAVPEFDGGDSRAPKQWGDFFIDLLPAAHLGVTFTPVSQGVSVAGPTVIATGTTRVRRSATVGGTVVSDFLGMLATWSEDFTSGQTLPTTLYLWQPSFVIQPAASRGWQTFGTSFGLNGYMHIREIALAWVSSVPFSLIITAIDGTSPPAITVPSSSGAYNKVLFPVGANKGQIFKFLVFTGVSAPCQLFLDDTEVRVGEWGRNSPYQTFKGFGGNVRDSAPI